MFLILKAFLIIVIFFLFTNNYNNNKGLTALLNKLVLLLRIFVCEKSNDSHCLVRHVILFFCMIFKDYFVRIKYIKNLSKYKNCLCCESLYIKKVVKLNVWLATLF